LKILVTDTNSNISEHICLIISRLQPDWKVVTVESGIECLAVLADGYKPDIVLTGMQLSDMSGFDLIKHIRDDSDIPIVLMSEEHNIELLVEAFETGANDYMSKPYHDAVFIARLKALARRRAWDIKKDGHEVLNYEFSEGIKG
jgi:DNA-binding response OmpR family regulator